MVVITLTDCPPKVRGDLSKWLCEVNTGVYVGNLSARVRQELWMRVCENLKNGRATMVYSAPGEQQLDFEVYNSSWEPVDFDGIKLMRHPLPVKRNEKENTEPETKGYTSKAGKMLEARRAQASKQKNSTYVVLDVETTGLSSEEDRIIEIAAIRIQEGKVVEEFQTLVNPNIQLKKEITELTGITGEMLKREGVSIKEALEKLIAFVGELPILCHNATFDCGFLRQEARRNQVQLFRNPCKDTLTLARRRVKGVKAYTLIALCEHFRIDATGAHRALKDCYLTQAVFEKLNEN